MPSNRDEIVKAAKQRLTFPCAPTAERVVEIARVIVEMDEELDQLRESSRTPGKCGHMENFLIGDEYGHFTCTVCSIQKLEVQLAEARKYINVLCTRISGFVEHATANVLVKEAQQFLK